MGTIYYNNADEKRVVFYSDESGLIDFEHGVILNSDDSGDKSELVEQTESPGSVRLMFDRPKSIEEVVFVAWITEVFTGMVIVHGLNADGTVNSTIHDVGFDQACDFLRQGRNRIDSNDIRMHVFL